MGVENEKERLRGVYERVELAVISEFEPGWALEAIDELLVIVLSVVFSKKNIKIIFAMLWGLFYTEQYSGNYEFDFLDISILVTKRKQVWFAEKFYYCKNNAKKRNKGMRRILRRLGKEMKKNDK